MKPKHRLIALGAAVAAILLYFVVFAAPAGPHSLRAFDPDRMADREVGMWKAYYEHRNVRLFTELVSMLHDEYRYPWAKATLAGFYLARAAARFSAEPADYGQVQLDLTAAYNIARDWTGGSYNPGEVAAAELAWWTARRAPGQNDPAYVGELIALENVQLFGVPRERLLLSGQLRARAARLRDDGGDHPDWPAVTALLRQSYRELHAAVNP